MVVNTEDMCNGVNVKSIKLEINKEFERYMRGVKRMENIVSYRKKWI